ncbi:MAG: YjjG family noncanonical pyrimidine nucleotidase [Chitinophagales bacterium]
MSYQYLLFDADNTLFDFDQTAKDAFAATFVAFGMQQETHHYEQYWGISQGCWRDFEAKKIDQETLRRVRFELFFEAAALEGNALKFNEKYLQNLVHHSSLLDGALDLLDGLHGKIPMAIITNGLKGVQRPRLKRTGLMDYFEAIVVSDEIGVSKPHAPFFDHTFEQINFPDKSEVLVIGDSLSSDIKGGNNYGLHTCWYNPKGLPNHLEVVPTYEIGDLAELYEIVNL